MSETWLGSSIGTSWPAALTEARCETGLRGQQHDQSFQRAIGGCCREQGGGHVAGGPNLLEWERTASHVVLLVRECYERLAITVVLLKTVL